MKKFIAAEYIKLKKGKNGKRVRTSYSLTTKGQHAFEEYIETMKRILSLPGIG